MLTNYVPSSGYERFAFLAQSPVVSSIRVVM